MFPWCSFEAQGCECGEQSSVAPSVFVGGQAVSFWSLPSLKLMAPENGWLKYQFPFGDGPIFRCESVSFGGSAVWKLFVFKAVSIHNFACSCLLWWKWVWSLKNVLRQKTASWYEKLSCICSYIHISLFYTCIYIYTHIYETSKFISVYI